ncbi:tRNA (guanine(37)-N1)-methyltransferase [Macrosteles quadrilineatus]|uniref:tRNA (guanine(37)-N1)-methyltransferase n=1 Tax=Macrosteles quadrilineatus TaxID=74068 RepID=UPI0023E0B632|nr:tRNA (guanine(37)-N1)-methyltransferase [Macrosteles quadrilineatus]
MAELVPPPSVRGMTKLDRSLFNSTITVPSLLVKTKSVVPLKDIFKQYLLRLRALGPIRPFEGDITNEMKEVILNPKLVSCFTDIQPPHREKLEQFEVTESNFKTCSLNLSYDNWTADDILKAVLPLSEGVDNNFSGYSMVGHIVHVNLKEHLLDYKYVIGEVLLDKLKRVRTVVNKVDNIENTFRVFKMEVLAGEPNFVTEVKENYVTFKFDFSSVYWNSRLSTEHQRIVNRLEPGSVLYDVFAGVGPFSIPAAKKKCTVLANDLNPESFKWLQHNAKINKVGNNFKAFNKDGADFIKEDIKQHILQEKGNVKSHIVMNLPALAHTFLPCFRNLFSADDLASVKYLPLTHVYCFVKGVDNYKEMAKELVESELNCSITESLDEITFVRNVAPNKEMMRVSFQLNENILLDKKRMLDSEETGKLYKRSK